jgi:catechol 2,3-dioxygenase-like lactoylglutathione lyase family enzyme
MATEVDFFHFGYSVAKIEKDVDFFQDFFGFELHSKFETHSSHLSTLIQQPTTEVKIAYLSMPGSGFLELIQWAKVEEVEERREGSDLRILGQSHLCFYVREIQSWFERVHAHSYCVPISREVVSIPTGPNQGSKVFFFQTISGIAIEMFEKGSNK